MTLYAIMEANGGYTVLHDLVLGKVEANKLLLRKQTERPFADWWIQQMFEGAGLPQNATEYEDIYNLN